MKANDAKLSYCCLLSKTFVRCSRALKTLQYIMVRDNVVRFNLLRFHFACFDERQDHDMIML